MTVLDWLRSRSPAPPPELMARVVEALGDRGTADVSGAPELCLDAAADLLERLLKHDPIGRQSANELLAADALVTYAFECAAVDIDRLDDRATEAMTRLGVLAAPNAPADA
jgi:hypothetical protein